MNTEILKRHFSTNSARGVLHRIARVAIALPALVLLGCVAATTYTEESAPEPSYRLNSGDEIRVTVFGHDDLSGEFAIDGDGMVSLPLIQILEAKGLTTEEVAQVITDKLRPDYLKNPKVSVDILSYRPFYIIGEVRDPGSYAFVSDMTVVTAVALAGGYSYRAAKNKITVIRGNDPEKRKVRILEDTRILPGDIIEIPERYF